MTYWEALDVIKALLTRDADCRCGNHTITEEDKKAIEIILDAAEND